MKNMHSDRLANQNFKKSILWLDNDKALIYPYLSELKRHNIKTEVTNSVLEAEELLKSSKFDLVIIDVMIPIINEKESKIYKSENTNSGLATGLIFYRRTKKTLKCTDTKVLILTVRLDEKIKIEFIKEGIQPENFATKLSLREISSFMRKIFEVLNIK